MNQGQNWDHATQLPATNYTCGYSDCGREVSSEKGWIHHEPQSGPDGWIYICPVCKRPTFFDLRYRGALHVQFPGVSLGNAVQALPPDIEPIWAEIRNSTSQGSHTSTVLLGRKLLMHIAVDAGAKPGLSFVDYVNYLDTNHYAPPNSKTWVDKIRSHGNEANHDIVIKKKEDAEEIMAFLEMLLAKLGVAPERPAATARAATPERVAP